MFILPPYGSLIFYFSLGRLGRTNIFYLFNINFCLDPLQLYFFFHVQAVLIGDYATQTLHVHMQIRNFVIF